MAKRGQQLKNSKRYQATIHSAVLQMIYHTKLNWHGGFCVKRRQMVKRGQQLKNSKRYQASIHSAVLQQIYTTKLNWHGGNCVK
eukprot:scaffold198064_cov30-Cyclotella_meneghiniana.AAC.1